MVAAITSNEKCEQNSKISQQNLLKNKILFSFFHFWCACVEKSEGAIKFDLHVAFMASSLTGTLSISLA